MNKATIAILVLLVIILFLNLGVKGDYAEYELRQMKRKAVEYGYGEWVIAEDTSVYFRWISPSSPSAARSLTRRSDVHDAR